MREPKDITILIVDDEPELRKALVFDFKRKGFTVFEAANGNEAFVIVKNQKLDIVLTDVRMPNGDGVELLDNIKGMNPEIPVVMFITGFADISLDDAYDKGVNAIFSKPFDRKALMAAVLRTVTPLDERWGKDKLERLESNFEIDLKFPELNLAISGKVINIGRGGMFVRLNDQFPLVDAKTCFSIRFDEGPVSCIGGNGVVRWIRSQLLEDHPAGCGIEFEYLTDESRNQLITVINRLKTKAFIPKS